MNVAHPQRVTTNGPTATTPRRRAGGMTLLELVLALAGTALIGLAVAAMLGAVTYGSTSRQGMRSLIVRQRMVTHRLAAAIRDARTVLLCATTPTADTEGQNQRTILVLWDHDANNNGQVDASELRRIAWKKFTDDDPASGRINCYAPLPGVDIDNDVPYANDADFDAVTRQLIAQGKLVRTCWAKAVKDWALTPVMADPDDPIDQARLVISNLVLSLKLSAKSPAISQRSLSTISLRAHPATSGL